MRDSPGLCEDGLLPVGDRHQAGEQLLVLALEVVAVPPVLVLEGSLPDFHEALVVGWSGEAVAARVDDRVQLVEVLLVLLLVLEVEERLGATAVQHLLSLYIVLSSKVSIVLTPRVLFESSWICRCKSEVLKVCRKVQNVESIKWFFANH